MNRGQKLALLINLAKELHKRGSWCGETHIQKATFFLQKLTEVDTGFEFILYKHGPFSFDLREAIMELVADGFFNYVVRNPGYGPTLVPTPDSQVMLERFPKTLEKYAPQLNFVADCIGNKGVGDLERVATALFIVTRERGLEGEEAAKELVRLKPHVHIQDARDAVIEAEKLIKRREFVN